MAHDIRSFGRGLLLAVDVLAAIVAASFVVAFYIAPGTVGAYDETTSTVSITMRTTAQDLTFLVAMVLLIVNVLFFLYGRKPARPLQYVSSDAPDGGVVKVSREALEAGLRTAGEGLDVVSRLRVSVDHGPMKRIVVHAHFQAPDGTSLRDASQELRVALSARFNEMVQSAEGSKAEFDIEFIGFYGKLPRGSERPSPPEEVEEEPSQFTGPKYPIPEDDSKRRTDEF